MLELFRVETETQTAVLIRGLLELERGPVPASAREIARPETPASSAGFISRAEGLESLMRAAHSLKGAARIVNLSAAVRLAHAMEDCFVAAQRGQLELRQPQIDVLLRGVDLLISLADVVRPSPPSLPPPSPSDPAGEGGGGGRGRCSPDETNLAGWEDQHAGQIDDFLETVAGFLPGSPAAKNRPIKRDPEHQQPTQEGAVKTCAAPGLGGEDGGWKIEDSQSGVAASPSAILNPLSSSGLRLPADAPPAPTVETPGQTPVNVPTAANEATANEASPAEVPADRVLRLTADNLNRLLGLAGESLVESRWLRPFSDSMQRLRRMQADLERTLEGLRLALEGENLSEESRARVHPVEYGTGRLGEPGSEILHRVNELFQQASEHRQYLAERLQELDSYDRRAAHLSNRLYLEVLRTRMRPFGDGTQRFPRMVRDLARSLGKQVRLEITGEETQVDRDILDRLETPLAAMLRNAVDHGCETPEERQRAGKPAEAIIRLEARHSAGLLQVMVSDDGAGLDPERVRRAVAARRLTASTVAERLNENELLQFLFLPGFTVKDTVTEISGRGVGLDIVQNMVRSVRGSVRATSQPGRGMCFQLQLPLTLSVLRTLLVDVGGEPYAFPLAQIGRTLRLPREKVETLEGRQHFKLGERPVGLLAAHQIFDTGQPQPCGAELPIVVLGERLSTYGVVVDRFLGERELVVQPLDPRLGKVKDISAAALMEDGSPVLIVDVDDLVRSIEKLIVSGNLAGVPGSAFDTGVRKRKRILAVDDSLTVRELERKLLENRGYQADVAVDGMDGWNAVRTGVYDLVITDVDMPRMDGIELASLIKHDPQLKSLPVMIVSYKDREEDRMRGLEAGADYYLAKGSFQDETLLQAVRDLIGEPA